MCLLGHTDSIPQALYYTASASTSCLHRASRSASNEFSAGFSGRAHSTAHVYVLLASQPYAGALQSPTWTSHYLFPRILVTIFSHPLVCSNHYYLLSGLKCEAIVTDCFWQITMGESYLHGKSYESGKIKTRPVRGDLEDTARSNNDHTLRMGLWRAPNTFCLIHEPYQWPLCSWYFTKILRLSIFKATIELGRKGWE